MTEGPNENGEGNGGEEVNRARTNDRVEIQTAIPVNCTREPTLHPDAQGKCKWVSNPTL